MAVQLDKSGLILFPHQLFEDHKLITPGTSVLLVEDGHFFHRFNFHKQKLILHRSSMQAYAKMLEKRGIQVFYFEQSSCKKSHTAIFEFCKKQRFKTLNYIDVVDDLLEMNLLAASKKHGIAMVMHENPSFLLSEPEVKKMLGTKKQYRMSSFYMKIRKHLNLLMEDGKPLGGKWSFDTLNRQPLDKNISLPPTPKANTNAFVKEAQQYIEKHFPDNPGSATPFIYPVTHKESLVWLDYFLKYKLDNFGTYQDSISSMHPFSFHSLLSPLINTGLLLPQQVINKAINYATKHPVPLNSLEGFIRQIIGWREFVRGVYIISGKQQRTSNFLHHKKRLPKTFWDGSTTLEPLDKTINKILKYSYAHHIERLMILGNFMLLSEIHPDDVYLWFMEMFIDAYDWVMIPNVYGMSQFAEGGLMTTKPYCSSSNYVCTMSDYKKGSWAKTWDGLYWNFIVKNITFLSKNARLSFVAATLKKMKPQKLAEHISIAQRYLKTLKEKS